MAATFTWQRSHGAGETISTATEINWKNIDDDTTAYTSAPITKGNNSFELWLAGKFSGTFTQIMGGLFAHTATAFGTGLTLKGIPLMNGGGDADRVTYTTPSTTANTKLTKDMTTAIAIASGVNVWFGPTGANNTGKKPFMTTNPCWTNYLTTQLQTTASAGTGDTATVTLTLSYDET